MAKITTRNVSTRSVVSDGGEYVTWKLSDKDQMKESEIDGRSIGVGIGRVT